MRPAKIIKPDSHRRAVEGATSGLDSANPGTDRYYSRVGDSMESNKNLLTVLSVSLLASV